MKSRLYIIHRITALVAWVFATVTALATILSAYAGLIDPRKCDVAPLIAMAYPIAVLGAVIVTLVCLFVCRRAAILSAAAIIVSIPTLLLWCPMHAQGKASADDSTFSVLSYNTYYFLDYRDTMPRFHADTFSTSLQAVLDARPDIAAFQETNQWASDTSFGTPRQRHLVAQLFPYRRLCGQVALWSRFPILKVDTLLDPGGSSSFEGMACRLLIGHDTLTLINVHLQSIMLSDSERGSYERLTELGANRHDIRTIKTDVISKIMAASVERARQAEYLRSVVATMPEPMILCGDFNDVPGSFAQRMFLDDGFHDAYADRGRGYTWTFRADNIYFPIDHTLWRGSSLHPLTADVIHGGLSDHYPTLTTFALTPTR